MKLLLQNKLVYGKVLVYPRNETARAFADILRKKTFSERELLGLLACGVEVEWLPDDSPSEAAGRSEGPDPKPSKDSLTEVFAFGPSLESLRKLGDAFSGSVSEGEGEGK